MTTRPAAACKVEWITIPAPALEQAAEFYAQVFGWEFSAFSPDFLLFRTGSVSGGLDRKLGVAAQGIGFSITVDDIPGFLQRIVAAGGAMKKEKCAIGSGFGFFAVFGDPNGNTIELWSKE